MIPKPHYLHFVFYRNSYYKKTMAKLYRSLNFNWHHLGPNISLTSKLRSKYLLLWLLTLGKKLRSIKMIVHMEVNIIWHTSL